MNRIRQTLKNDLWVILLDIFAVNFSYYLALLLRSAIDRVASSGSGDMSAFFGIFYRFAPWYTILCLVVFFLFRLYGGLWRYAGINDMNRILGASVVTCLIQILGTVLFARRMPISYYGLGAAFQFLFVAAIRFGYRVFVIERRRSGKKNANAIVVGAGDLGRQTVEALQTGVSFNVGALIDAEGEHVGKSMDGIPVYGPEMIEEALERFGASCVFLAEPNLKEETREQIKKACEARKIEIRDYTSFFNFTAEQESNVDVVKAPAGKKSIPFSPPDIGESEIGEVVEALRSGWITTGPRTKLLERRLAAYIETGRVDVDTEADIARWSNRVVCLNSATASEELNLRILGIRPGDEVIVPAYTYTASASAAIHCGATVKFVDIQKDGDKTTHMPEMDYEKLEAAIGPKTKAVVVVDLGGIVADYDKVYEIVERKRAIFTPLESDGTPLGDLSSRIQHAIGRVAVVSDCAHSLGASRVIGGKKLYCGAIADFTDFSFHAVKNFTTAEGGASTWREIPGVANSEIYKFYQLLSLHGQNKDALAKTKAGASNGNNLNPHKT